MLSLNPSQVTLAGTSLANVRLITIDRAATRLVVEHTDLGPHPAFADAPEQRVTIRLVRAVIADEAPPAKPGDSLALSFRTSANASAAGGRAISATIVVTAVEYKLNQRDGVQQTITALALSSDGAADPITDSQSPGVF